MALKPLNPELLVLIIIICPPTPPDYPSCCKQSSLLAPAVCAAGWQTIFRIRADVNLSAEVYWERNRPSVEAQPHFQEPLYNYERELEVISLYFQTSWHQISLNTEQQLYKSFEYMNWKTDICCFVQKMFWNLGFKSSFFFFSLNNASVQSIFRMWKPPRGPPCLLTLSFTPLLKTHCDLLLIFRLFPLVST